MVSVLSVRGIRFPHLGDPRPLISSDVRVGPRLYRGRVISLRRAWLGIYLSAAEELRGAFDDILRYGKGSLAVRRREHIGSGFTGIAIGVRGWA